MKAYMCANTKANVHETKAYKHTKIVCFCRTDVHSQ